MPKMWPTKDPYRADRRKFKWHPGKGWGLGFAAAVSLLVCAVAGHTSASAAETTAKPFSFETVREQARALAAREYQPGPGVKIPDFLKNLSYDQYQDIRFRPEKSPWYRDHLRFDLEFFHPGFIYPDPVSIHLVENGAISTLAFSPQQFDYGKNQFPEPVPDNLGFSGFRVIYQPSSDHRGSRPEVASFLGASYFRMVGTRQRYGSSFRGLAIDTGEPGGEEFPKFVDFWIERPGAAARYLQCFALLDSPSCAGAYRLILHPGDSAVIELEASLFVRKGGRKIGLAPLTSMFLMGKNRTSYLPDFRPEVHDADGLLVQASRGERLWRPLVNPPKVHHMHRFAVDGLAGFGLLQREREFHCYEDLNARYELRPSLWVKPQNNWGPGAVELVEIPSPNEYNDNIVAYWIPKEKTEAGQELHWTCRLSAMSDGPDEGSLARVVSTRLSPAHDKVPCRFVLDFSGDCLPALEPNERVEASAQASRGEIRNLVTEPNEVTGGWRVFFDLAAEGHEETKLRVALQESGRPLSETWIYHYQAE